MLVCAEPGEYPRANCFNDCRVFNWRRDCCFAGLPEDFCSARMNWQMPDTIAQLAKHVNVIALMPEFKRNLEFALMK